MKVLNDILGYDLKIYQDQEWFCFSIDSIILANFSQIKPRTKKILDLGCGNGIIPLILSLRTKAHIDGVEIQKDLADMALESINYNKLENQINIYNMNMVDFLEKKELYNTYDLIVCNPPYFRKNEKSTKNFDVHKVIARHEVSITLEEIINISFKFLKDGAIFSTVNRCDRLIDVITLLKKYNFEPKYIRLIHNDKNSMSTLFYLEAAKCGKSGLIIDKPFIMYENEKASSDYDNLIKEVM